MSEKEGEYPVVLLNIMERLVSRFLVRDLDGPLPPQLDGKVGRAVMERDVLHVSLSPSLSLSLSIVLELRGLKWSLLPPSVLLNPTRYHV